MPLRNTMLSGFGAGRNSFPLEAITVTRVAQRTGTGTQDIIVPGFGPPVAAIFIFGRGTTDGVEVVQGCYFSFGVTDGTTHWVISGAEVSTSTTTVCDMRGATDEVIQRHGNGTIFDEANFDSWITDGVRINWGVNGGANILLHVVLFGGSITADVSTITPAIQDSVVTATPGFEFDALIGSFNSILFNDTNSATWISSLGFASYNGLVRQSVFEFRTGDALGTTATQCEVRDDAIATILSDRFLSVENVTSTQFDLRSTGFDASGDDFGYLALNFGSGGGAWTGVLDSPIVTGNNSWINPSFEPIFGLLLPNTSQTINTTLTDGQGAGFSVSAFTATEEFTMSWFEEDAQDVQDQGSLSDDQAINLDFDDGTNSHDATFSSFDDAGTTLNFSVVDGTAQKWPALFITTAPADPLWNDVVILLPFNGTDADTSTTDRSLSAHSPSTFTGAAKISNTQSKFGPTSAEFDGTADMITFPDSADWILGTGTFAIEAHIRLRSIGTALEMIAGQFGWTASFQGWGLFVRDTDLWFYYHDGVLRNFAQAWSPQVDTWYHVCCERDTSSDVRLFVDGVALGSPSNITNNIRNVTTAFSCGWRPGADSGANDLDGWIDNVRLTTGFSSNRYGGNFTPLSRQHPEF